MQKEFLEMVNKFNENVLESAERVGDLNMRTFKQFTAKQAEVVNECMESSAKQVEVLTTAKDYKTAVAAQSELLKGCNAKFITNVRETAEMMAAVRQELAEMVEEAVKYTSASVEKVGDMAAKKAA